MGILAGWRTSTQPYSDANSDAKYQKMEKIKDEKLLTKSFKFIGINVVTSSTALLISSQDD